MNYTIEHSYDLKTRFARLSIENRFTPEVGDKGATWRVKITDGGEDVSLSGATITATFVLPDGTSDLKSGAADGSAAVISFPASACSLPGEVTAFISVTKSGDTFTADIIRYTVRGDATGEYVDPEGILPNINELREAAQDALDAADAAEEAAGDALDAAAQSMPYINYVGLSNPMGISWTLRKNISNGDETNSQYTALSNFLPPSPTVVRTGADADGNGVALSMFVHEYDSTKTWLRRTAINATEGKTMHPQSDCAYIRFVFGRASSTGVEIAQSDIDTYFGADVLISMRAIVAELEQIGAQTLYTALMTDTILEGE